MKPETSIIMPAYNSAPFIAASIESVLRQSYTDWELLVSDYGSTDETIDIVKQFCAHDPRVKLLTAANVTGAGQGADSQMSGPAIVPVPPLSHNGGAAVARNRAIEAAQGRFIAFLDSDDQWLPEKLERQIAFMKESGHALTHTHYRKIAESGQDLGINVTPPPYVDYAEMLKSNRIGCLSAIYDSHKTGGKRFMPLIRKRQDYGLWLSILKDGHGAYCLPEILALYRVRKESVSSNKLELLSYNWQLFYRIEQMPAPRAAYYLGWNIWRKLRAR